MDQAPSGDVERIYALLDLLKQGQGMRFIESNEGWEVSFHGDASLRHANRISRFREFLASQLLEDVKVAGARIGSVVIEYAIEARSPSSSARSRTLLQRRELLTTVARELGIRSIAYGGEVLEFEGTGVEVMALAGPGTGGPR